MAGNIEIKETEVTNEFTTLEVSGASSNHEAFEAIVVWCEQHNCMCKEFEAHEDQKIYTATVCPDDYV